ncbi:MAG: L-seryl-tRNA(Sec) selenium transferase [Thermodesulfobacteriota bacterium]
MIENKKSYSAEIKELLRSIPGVDEFLSWVEGMTGAPQAFVKAAVQEVLAEERRAIINGELRCPADLERRALIPKFENRLSEKQTPNFRNVVNATGVIIHTNMGRSLLPEESMAYIDRVGKGYSNLEFDLATGKRGSRYSLVEDLVCGLTGAEAGLVVNNNAAAVLLVLDTLAKDREVIVSRGQLVEIGGSFRIPEVMRKSGGRLVEVGTTNRTHLQDYEEAINENTALLLKVHMSNYRIIGFTSEVPLREMVELGARRGLLVVEDLGSGCLVDLSSYGLESEPTVQDAIREGVDVVTFSGDKLLGGPQAGLILGRKRIIEKIKSNPLNRALRIDKFTLAGLESVFRLYFDGKRAEELIPTLAMMRMPLEKIEERVRYLLEMVREKLEPYCRLEIAAVQSRVGGGALPEQGLASRALALTPSFMKISKLESGLRKAPLPVIGRVEHDRMLFDMRTVSDNELEAMAESLIRVLPS